MDKSIYIGMSGQKNSLHELEMLSNNLANVNTPGFRADYNTIQQAAIKDSGLQSRVYAKLGNTYTDFKPGSVLHTGRDLDTAISGKGFFSVQSKSGTEGYTRAGNFEISSNGFLMTSTGNLVLGTSGPIQIPNGERLQIGEDGVITIKPLGEKDLVKVGQLKLVNPELKNIIKGPDGLFYTKDNKKLSQDDKMKIVTGALEGSNVNPVDTLIKLIDTSRQYEIQAKYIKNLSDQAIASNKILDYKA